MEFLYIFYVWWWLSECGGGGGQYGKEVFIGIYSISTPDNIIF